MKDFKKDYYKILALLVSSSDDDVKLAYRQQAKKYHPDLNPNNPDSDTFIREINEAYEVLGNKDERFVYDQYLLSKKLQRQKELTSEYHKNRNKHTYTTTTTQSAEKRTYLTGKIFFKYCGKHDEKEAENIFRETFYKLKITQTDAIIEKTYTQPFSTELLEVFALNKPLDLKIQQPVSCQILNKDNVIQDYRLNLINLTVPNPEIINVTKHEGESFGVITGKFYCYLKQEIKIEVTECFGETGEIEKKTKDGVKYFRNEYYNSDCSKYWGNWIAEIINPIYKPTGRTQKAGNYTRSENKYANSQVNWGPWRYSSQTIPANSGCLDSLGSFLLVGLGGMFILFLVPKLTFLLPFLLIPFLLNLLPLNFWNWSFRIAFILFGLFFSLAIITSIFRLENRNNEQKVVKPIPVIDKPKYTPVINPRLRDHVLDTMIAHRMVWTDYNGKAYDGNFSVRKSALDQAHFYKQNLDIISDSENSYDKIIFLLKENDRNKLSGLYTMFDSIRVENKPSSMLFAEIIVSFVQTIPYTLILPEACDSRYYQDAFTAKYLSKPGARCDGFEKYGINTPVEFISYLNGDCDTRTLLLYTMLSHYNFDVVVLSSTHYSHSILGINLPYDGSAFNYNNQRYIFWETTAKDIKPGVISNEISNTDYWRISLKSK